MIVELLNYLQAAVPYIKVIAILLIALFIIGLIDRYVKRFLISTTLPGDVRNFVRRLINYFLWFSVLIYLMTELNLEVVLVPVIGASFLIGASIALAVKDMLADTVAGVFLITDKHFDIGDEIETMGHRGEVISVTLRKTRIRTGETKIVVLPNGKIDAAGWTLHEKRPCVK